MVSTTVTGLLRARDACVDSRYTRTVGEELSSSMLGISRPSSVTVAFQCWKLGSRSSMSCPRSATRTGCEDSGETRYWYQEMSQANVSTISALTPESGMIDACGSPSALATPAIVRRNCVALNSSAASTRAISSSPSRRRIGSLTTGSISSSRAPRIDCQRDFCRRLRGGAWSIGEIATPSLTQP